MNLVIPLNAFDFYQVFDDGTVLLRPAAQMPPELEQYPISSRETYAGPLYHGELALWNPKIVGGTLVIDAPPGHTYSREEATNAARSLLSTELGRFRLP